MPKFMQYEWDTIFDLIWYEGSELVLDPSLSQKYPTLDQDRLYQIIEEGVLWDGIEYAINYSRTQYEYENHV